ncbi:Tc1 transposase-like protein [Plakobranchus ocellatus]|uniref:Tc1 transposase-like protein n=1 Tax=Plakobranchus ocellatus TaxID=259542 RepID=A0AAV3YI81_9GAST|nr:Tc1 transposase-like protein [Plakobranchus ocellatus]
MRAVVRAVVEEHPDFTIRNIKRELRTRLPQSPAISQTTISGILDGLLVTTKKLEDASAERNLDRTKQQRHAYATWLMHEVQETESIFMDEAGINIWTKRTRGRAVRGRRAVCVVQGRRGANLTMTFAVSNVGGLIYHELTEGNDDDEDDDDDDDGDGDHDRDRDRDGDRDGEDDDDNDDCCDPQILRAVTLFAE